jgi:tetratricopeptide (TPR) repeat protein
MTRRRCAHQPYADALARGAARVGAAALAGAFALVLAACSSARPPQNPAQQTSHTLAQAAARAWARGDATQARTFYERALAAAESVEDFELAGAMLLNLALVQASSGDLAGAHARVDRIIATPQRYGSALVARAAARKALLFVDGPDVDAALTWTERAQCACGSPCALDATLSNLRAHVALQSGDTSGAAQWATRAATQAADQTAEQANALRLLGRARSQLAQHDDAAKAFAQALVIDRKLGLPDRVALDLLDAGDNEAARGRHAAAREFYERALDVYQAAGRQPAADGVRRRLATLPAAR